MDRCGLHYVWACERPDWRSTWARTAYTVHDRFVVRVHHFLHHILEVRARTRRGLPAEVPGPYGTYTQEIEDEKRDKILEKYKQEVQAELADQDQS
mmetsp:Transcript_37434/g.68489  ORF Transcript_37434/g.68489 Transcript_37434/m.68489 type:complete len:96 (+) Transcript_37434:84-371(+)